MTAWISVVSVAISGSRYADQILWNSVAAWIVVVLVAIATSRYMYQIYRRDVNPALSTWVIFFVGGFLSFLTYIHSGKNLNFETGIFNTVDMIGDMLVVLAIILWVKKPKLHFELFERLYLSGAVTIVIFWIISENPIVSNALLQLLIAGGYIPTIRKVIKNKRNTDSFYSWGIYLVTSSVALSIGLGNHDTLATLYALKSVIMTTVVLITMIVYTKKKGVIEK